MGRGRQLAILLGSIVLALCLVPLAASDYHVSLVLDVLMWVALTESWIILSGYTGYISLGHSAFYGLGAYLMAMTATLLPYGLVVILAGLLSDEMRKNIQKVPMLGDIPILGALFRSSRDELSQTELAFFITPKLVKPIPAGQKTELPTDRVLTPEEEREFNWIPLPGKSGGDK